jgi:hypothetical protein
MKDSDKQLQYLSVMIAASVFPSISLQLFNVSEPYYLDERFSTTELPTSFSPDVLGENYNNLKNAVNTGKNLLKSIIVPARAQQEPTEITPGRIGRPSCGLIVFGDVPVGDEIPATGVIDKTGGASMTVWIVFLIVIIVVLYYFVIQKSGILK